MQYEDLGMRETWNGQVDNKVHTGLMRKIDLEGVDQVCQTWKFVNGEAKRSDPLFEVYCHSCKLF